MCDGDIDRSGSDRENPVVPEDGVNVPPPEPEPKLWAMFKPRTGDRAEGAGVLGEAPHDERVGICLSMFWDGMIWNRKVHIINLLEPISLDV